MQQRTVFALTVHSFIQNYILHVYCVPQNAFYMPGCAPGAGDNVPTFMEVSSLAEESNNK